MNVPAPKPAELATRGEILLQRFLTGTLLALAASLLTTAFVLYV